jgi:citrate lyase subunit beta/citryl-CoA lyase
MQEQIQAAGLDCVLRVNRPTRQMVRDIEAADFGALAAIMVPKCESAALLAIAAELVGDLAVNVPRPSLVALIETPGALLNLKEIAAFPCLKVMMLGSEDYCAALGVSPEDGALEFPAALLAAACAERDLLAIGLAGSLANFTDLNLYARNLGRARQLGFPAVAAIHPAQLPIIRQHLAPTAAEITWADQVLAVAGSTSGAVVGSALGMIDAPVLARARRIVEVQRKRRD